MTPAGESLLIEAATSTHRERDREGRILPHPAWADLGPEGRQRLHEAQRAWRALERALDAEGLSGTARVVLARIGGLHQATPDGE